jgi:hypothetical protein
LAEQIRVVSHSTLGGLSLRSLGSLRVLLSDSKVLVLGTVRDVLRSGSAGSLGDVGITSSARVAALIAILARILGSGRSGVSGDAAPVLTRERVAVGVARVDGSVPLVVDEALWEHIAALVVQLALFLGALLDLTLNDDLLVAALGLDDLRLRLGGENDFLLNAQIGTKAEFVFNGLIGSDGSGGDSVRVDLESGVHESLGGSPLVTSVSTGEVVAVKATLVIALAPAASALHVASSEWEFRRTEGARLDGGSDGNLLLRDGDISHGHFLLWLLLLLNLRHLNKA